MSTMDGAPTRGFSEKDSEKVVEFLNFIATNAKFDGMDVKKVIQFTKMLNWMQTDLLPRIEAHRFEILSVKEAVADKKEAAPSKRK